MQVAVKVTFWPTVGNELLAEAEHTGGTVGGAVQLTDLLAGLPAPELLVATSVYVLLPAGELTESVQLVLLDAQPVHANDVGPFVQDAVIVMVWPSNGVSVLEDNVHVGVGVGSACQSTGTYAVLLPEALPAVTP